MWDAFKHVEESVFEKAVNFLIGEATTQALPALSRFKEAVAMFQERKRSETGGHPNDIPKRTPEEQAAVDQARYEAMGVLLKWPKTLPYNPNDRSGA
jgi:hypothetical protein